jgi:hypothetical protein
MEAFHESELDYRERLDWALIALFHKPHVLAASGRRYLCLVQSDNPELHFGRVGGLEPGWNPQEWFDKDRGL